MRIWELTIETAKINNKLTDLRNTVRELTMEAGLKAVTLIKQGHIENDSLEKLSDAISDINNAIQVASIEAKIEKNPEFSNEIPKWRIFLEKVIYKIMNIVSHMESQKKYDALVARGEDYLEEAGKIALTLPDRKLETVQIQIERLKKELNELIYISENREKEGKAGITFLATSISMLSSFYSFFKKKFQKK